MINTFTLFMVLSVIVIWGLVRYFLPKIISNQTLLEEFRTKKKTLLVRVSIVTGLLLIWGISVIAVTGGVSHENNKIFLGMLLLVIGLVWVVGIAIPRKR